MLFLYTVVTPIDQPFQNLLYGMYIKYCISHSYNCLSLPSSGTIPALIIVFVVVVMVVVCVVVCVVVKRNSHRNNRPSGYNTGQGRTVEVSSTTWAGRLNKNEV